MRFATLKTVVQRMTRAACYFNVTTNVYNGILGKCVPNIGIHDSSTTNKRRHGRRISDHKALSVVLRIMSECCYDAYQIFELSKIKQVKNKGIKDK